MGQKAETDMRKPLILLLAAPETSGAVLYGLFDVLSSVGSVYDDMVMGSPGAERLDVRIVSAEDGPFKCSGGVPVEPHHALSEVDAADAVIVCDMYLPIHADPSGSHPEAVAWLARMHRAGAYVSSVCSGSVLLAESGILDNRTATAHWAYRDLFQRRYPKVTFDGGSMLCLASARDRVVTAGGVSAWHDLAMWLITMFCGQKQAFETAKVFLISGHYEGQSPYAVMTRPMESNDAVIADCQNWIAETYAASNPVERMAERSGLNPRTFARRFRAATGYTAIEYVQALRIEEAKQALEVEDTAIDDIGAAVGYEDPASFRRVFKRHVGMPPAAYRRKYQRLAGIARGEAAA